MIYKQGVYLKPQFYFRRMSAYKQLSVLLETDLNREIASGQC